MACSSTKEVVGIIKEPKKPMEVYDLTHIPQEVRFFTKDLNNSDNIYDIQKEYEKYYFNVWNDLVPRESQEAIKWPFKLYKSGNSYGENLQLLKQSFFDAMLENANFSSYGSVNKRAISTKHLSIRSFPTDKPLLRDPKKAGEGFPFDYLQNTTIQANKPLFISHYSKDRAWIYIFSSFASGWVKSRDIAIIKQEHVELWQKAKQIIFIKENIPLYAQDGTFLFYSKIGTILPLISVNKNSFTVLAISSHATTEPLFQRVVISKDIALRNVLSINKDALDIVMNEIIKSNYGWGGLYGQRDCSSTLRDMYAPFGIWLPRNSSQQAKVGKVINLKDLNNEEKIDTIKEQGIPFETLLYKQGHIVLYVGILDDEIIIFHNTWGVKTKKENKDGRFVIGKTLFSTLKLGKNLKNYDESSELLRNLESMNIITH